MSTTVFEKVGNVLTVKPVGRMDTATSPVLEQELESQIDGVQEIVMDFADVEYISSGGMRVLLAVEQQLEEKNGSLRLDHVNNTIINIFKMVGFMEIIKIEQD